MDDWKCVVWLLVGIVIGVGWVYVVLWYWLYDVDVCDEMECVIV